MFDTLKGVPTEKKVELQEKEEHMEAILDTKVAYEQARNTPLGTTILKEGNKLFLHRHHRYEYLKWNPEWGEDFIPLDSWSAKYRFYLRCARCGREIIICEVSLI